MMGGQRAAEDDILDQLLALKGLVHSADESIIQDAIDEIASLRQRLAASNAALETATTGLNRLGTEVAVLRASRRDRERKAP